MDLFLFIGLMLSFARPESREAQSLQAEVRRATVRRIERGW